MGESLELTTFESILNCVYIIRGQQIMLDHDLAQIYGYEVKNLNRQVKRNIARFPQDFMFQLTKEEYDNLRCQNVTANSNSMSRSLPYAFTEQGVYMLATVLKGELAEQQSIFIMRAFKEMRHFIVQNQQFVTQPEMNMLTARVSELSIQLTGIMDHQNKTDKDVEAIHEGASSKDAGNKLCAINALSETSIIHPVIDKLLSLPDRTI